MTEPQSLQILAKAYFTKDRATRTSRERQEFLRALGVKHPRHFLASVWSPNWEEAIDRVLDPRSTLLRPLEPADFHSKWAVGAINLLPRETRLNILNLKMKPAGLAPAISSLLAAAGYPDQEFVVEDVEVLRFIHAEYAIQVRTADSRRVRMEISHYLPAAEEVFHRFAEKFAVPVTKISIGSAPQGKKFVIDLQEPDRIELSEAPHERLASFAERIITRAALHDALGDVLGTIMRDPHYLLDAEGELYSFHHYQLFLDMEDEQFGFFRPVFTLLGEELGNENDWFAKYRAGYIKEFHALQARRDEILAVLDQSRAIVDEYIGRPGEFPAIRAGVEKRLKLDPARRADSIGLLFCEPPPPRGQED